MSRPVRQRQRRFANTNYACEACFESKVRGRPPSLPVVVACAWQCLAYAAGRLPPFLPPG